LRHLGRAFLCLLSLGKTKESESAPAGDETRDAPTAKIQNPKSKIQNPKSKIQNPKPKTPKTPVEGHPCCAAVTPRVPHTTLWNTH
ncbi:hypothetical protein, partial [Ralstonia sp.]|uniref:hypothetical protein n=1 Tax=Ralstonia sp. TaxID=54061 RepID=UPI0031E48DC8